MPIAASMGGNAGTQTLTVAVRAIAMKELTTANSFRVLSKEVLVGTFNGLIFALIIGVIAWIWSGSVAIGAVMAAAMVITMIIASSESIRSRRFLALRAGTPPDSLI